MADLLSIAGVIVENNEGRESTLGGFIHKFHHTGALLGGWIVEGQGQEYKILEGNLCGKEIEFEAESSRGRVFTTHYSLKKVGGLWVGTYSGEDNHCGLFAGEIREVPLIVRPETKHLAFFEGKPSPSFLDYLREHERVKD